ncbi:MAG: hypothetical protein EA392_06950 [Cryomorphaceae bacterium]|nr:MAG: hypothetical protein EA392_06950 [Cryomorphaceae bacterium]
MRQVFLLFALALMLGPFMGCKKTELEGAYANYQGSWYGPGIQMTLYSNGRADYTEYSGSATKTITGGRLVIDSSTLRISALFVNQRFNIDQAPKQTEYGWTMVLDGKTFQK